MKYHGSTFRLITVAAAIVALAGPILGQTADEHASHHAVPGGASPSTSSAAPSGMPMPDGGNTAAMPAGATGGNQPNIASGTNPAPAPGAMAGNQPVGAGGGTGAGMGEMMKQMGTPPRKELYPSLMALPDQGTPEERAGIEQLARERMKEGAALMSAGLAKLSDSTSDQDFATMQQAAAQMHEGLAEFEAGIAARRVLSEGTAPRNLALDWFKREMNLASPIPPEEPRHGVTPFHLFTMVLLIAFALAMIAMYFYKMRRAAALFGRLGPDTSPPPPGGSSAVPVPGGDAANAG